MDPEVDETPAAKRLKQDGPAKDSAQAAAASAHEAQHQGAASSMPAGPASQGEEKQPGRKLSRKEKQLQKDPAKAKSAEIYRGIQMCARSGDLAAAVSYLEQAQAEGMRLQLSSFNSLMYLAVGGDRWEALARQGFPAQRAVENVRDAGRLASNSTASSSKSSGSSGSEGEESDREDGGRQDGRSEGSSRGVSVQEGAPGGKQATSTPPAPDAPPRKKRGRPPSEKTLAARAAAAAAAAAAAEGGNVQGAQQDAGSGGKTGLSGDGAPASVDAGSGKVGQVDEDQSPAAVGRLEHVAAASKVWSAMQAAGVAPDTGTYLALARMEGLRGDPDASLNWVKTCLSSGLSIQLRMVHPALVGYCMQRNSAAALQLDAFLTEQGTENLDRTEYEYARLVEVLASDARADWASMQSILMRMRSDLNELQSSTVQLLEAYFQGSLGKKALVGCGTGEQGQAAQPMQWQVGNVEVDESGYSPQSGAKLQVIDLEDADWENFAHGVAELAKRQERSGRNDFEKYMEWEARNGPYDLFIDAANVAFYGQNYVGGGFNWRQVKRMVAKVDKAHPDKKLLVMVHKRRTMDPEAKTPEVQAFLEGLRRRKAFYYTPMGSNDDWYWMYAAVRAKHKGLLVSNDELRDHIWGMLRPKHFLKWKARHIAQYRFAKFDDVGEPSLIYPPAYTSCVQQLDNGAWMFPCWEPEPADAAQQADSAPGSHGDHGSSVSGRGDVHAGESGHGQGSGGGQQKERGKAPGGGPPVTKGAHGAAQQAVSAPAESGGRVRWLCARPVPAPSAP